MTGLPGDANFDIEDGSANEFGCDFYLRDFPHIVYCVHLPHTLWKRLIKRTIQIIWIYGANTVVGFNFVGAIPSLPYCTVYNK